MEHRLGRKTVKQLNRLPQLAALSLVHPNEQAAGNAFGELMEAAETLGVVVLAVVGGGRKLDSGGEEYRHELAKVGTEDELYTDSTLIRQLYFHPHGSVEVTAYFS